MKNKIVISVLMLIFVLVASISINAADTHFNVDIAGDTVISAGKEYTYTVKVNGITVEGGLISADIELAYDSAIFEVSDVSGTPINGWSMLSNIKTAGKIVLRPGTNDQAAEDNEAAYAVKNDNAICYTIKLKAKETTEKTTALEFVSAMGGDASYNTFDGTGKNLSISVQQKLPTPTTTTFENGIARWDAVENANSYSIQIFKNSKEYGEPYRSDKNEYDFSAVLKDGGIYTFSVTAVSDAPEFASSDESQQSTEYKVIGNLAAPTITIYPDLQKGGVKYQITDTNPDGSVKQYIIDIYANGSSTAISSTATPNKAGNIPCGDGIEPDTQLTVTVTAVSADENAYKTSLPSEKSASAVVSAKVSNIVVKTPPKLVYIEGEALDFSAMVITLNFDNNRFVNVTYDKFADYDLSVNAEQGAVLAMSDNGKTITVSFGEGNHTAALPALTVNSSVCPHTKTYSDRTEPTCGEDGYDRVICDSCKVTISETKLPATGEHQYGDWEVVAQPTATLNGVQRRTCGVCGSKETETIPATGNDTTETTTGETTTEPDDTEPDGTDEPDDPIGSDVSVNGGDEDPDRGMNDLSKIFLIIVIVIFSLILVFIIGAVWLENRKSKARRARASRNSANRRR